tara:strand:+ start:88 stop:582 length:495 start_codon:yes stop_codon:yes gene_type:complete
MNIFKNLFLQNNSSIDNQKSLNHQVNQFDQIGKILKEARIKKNISIEELSRISKIPKYTINSIENNIEQIRPKHPFIRSILFKLEDCLSLKKNSLAGLLIKENKNSNQYRRDFLLKNFDFINSWFGSVFYFIILVLTIFILKIYFASNISVIEIQNIQEKINEE